MGFLKWAHFPPNSQLLLRYDSLKMGRFHAFPPFCIGKWAKIGPKFKLANEILGLQELYMTQNLSCIILGINSRVLPRRFSIL